MPRLLPLRPVAMEGLVRAEDQQQPNAKRGMTRLTSPEKWEIKQLIAAGVFKPSDYPGFDEETGILPGGDDPGSDEDVEIEIVDYEPVFLRGQTKLTVSHSPVRIVKVRACVCVCKVWFTIIMMLEHFIIYNLCVIIIVNQAYT